MGNLFIRHKVGSILLAFSLLILGACSKSQPSEDLVSASPQETEQALISEPLPKEPTIAEVDLENYFEGINGAAVLYDPAENSYQIYNQEVALMQRSPCSTFKIISSLIALENKVVEPDNSTRTWSGEVFWNEEWNRDIGFEDAFRTSCVWYFREVIDEIGDERMQSALDELQYGNCDISDWEGRLNTNNNNRALTGFWIESSLKISPKEQVEVMERIFGEDSIYSQESQAYLKQVMLLPEQKNSGTLIYGKTGLGKSRGVVVDAWFTGFADTSEGRTYFCVYLGETDGKNVSSTKAKEIAIEIVSSMEMAQ
jgi:bla regulator protein BlaR1